MPAQSATQPKLEEEFFLPDLCGVQALLVLVLLSALLALLAVLLRHGLFGFDWISYAMASLFMLWSALGSAGLLCRLRPWLAGMAVTRAAAVSFALILAVVAAVSIAGQWLGSALSASAAPWRLDGAALLANLIICAVLAGVGLHYLYVAQQLRLREQSELAARVQALQSRIQPHFLFNSLNSIASLVAVDAAAAEQAVEDLAALFRASLQEASSASRWQLERALCERYLRIEQLRLGERLRVQWRVQALPDALPLPSLSLQPLLENAIVHGLQELPAGGCIEVDGELTADAALITVRNPVNPAAPRPPGSRMALDNIHHRLQALYGEGAGLHILCCDGEQFAVQLRLPLLPSRSKPGAAS